MTSEVEPALTLAFRPKARVLQLLGDQLIGSPRLALFELVKNAYDADAESVTITFDGLDEDGTITIEDDGSGMSLATIRDVWLVPAHGHRETQRMSGIRTPKGRLPLGEKGLGRFAVHKLGNRIKLTTRVTNGQECVIDIDWNKLIHQEFLSDAVVDVRVAPAPKVFVGNRHGTKLEITSLRGEVWTRGEIRSLFRQVTSISSPFTPNGDGFVVNLGVKNHLDWTSGLPTAEKLLGRAPWSFEFEINGGRITWSYRFHGVPGMPVEKRSHSADSEPLQVVPDKVLDAVLGLKKQVVAHASFHSGIGPIRGRFYIFDRDRNVLSALGDASMLKAFLDEQGGVRVYRDGIRVYNYGEPGDDWLGLDLRRVNAPTRAVSRNIIVGEVHLSLETSTGLNEKTNREGFIDNRSLRRLTQLVLGALTVFEFERKIDKGRLKALDGSPVSERGSIREPIRLLRAAALAEGVLDKLDPLISRIEAEFDTVRETMLRSGLAGLGVAVVFHELEHSVRSLQRGLEGGMDSDTAVARIRELVKMLDGFSDLTKRGETRTQSLQQLIRQMKVLNSVRFRKHDIMFECPALNQTPEQMARFNFGLAIGALTNLVDNAIYWMDVRWPTQPQGGRALFVDVLADYHGGPAIVIADNGPGFRDLIEHLVRPFYSRRPTGMGLGLYYANSAMETMGGRLLFPSQGELDIPPKYDGAIVALTFAKEA